MIMNPENKEIRIDNGHLKNAEYILKESLVRYKFYSLDKIYFTLPEIYSRFCNVIKIPRGVQIIYLMVMLREDHRCVFELRFPDYTNIQGDVSYSSGLEIVALALQNGWNPTVEMKITDMRKLENYEKIIELLACANFD